MVALECTVIGFAAALLLLWLAFFNKWAYCWLFERRDFNVFWRLDKLSDDRFYVSWVSTKLDTCDMTCCTIQCKDYPTITINISFSCPYQQAVLEPYVVDDAAENSSILASTYFNPGVKRLGIKCKRIIDRQYPDGI